MNMIFLKRKPASFFEKKQAKVLETIHVSNTFIC